MAALVQNLAIPFLLTLAFFGLFLAILFPYFSGDRAFEKRLAPWMKSERQTSRGLRMMDPVQRRKQIAESLQEIDLRARMARRLTLDQRLMQAGLRISQVQFYTWSNMSGSCFAFAAYMFSGQAWGIFIGFVCGALVLPRLILFWLRRRRMARFMAHFATALEVIIRGVKAGLPVPECLKIVIREVPEPVRSEFILATEAQILGLTLAESLMRLADRVPAAETRFFAILMTIQQRSGGNLVEALSNLVHVLRARKRIVDKIQAMSAEAKASAGIIGLLPFCVAALVYVTSPGYLDMLWTTHEGNIMLAVALIWMLIGILIMRRMISFDF